MAKSIFLFYYHFNYFVNTIRFEHLILKDDKSIDSLICVEFQIYKKYDVQGVCQLIHNEITCLWTMHRLFLTYFLE